MALVADVVADGASLAPWIQAGGVVVFATAVLVELRALRPVLTSVQTLLAQLLERERMRSERVAARDTRPPSFAPRLAPVAYPTFEPDETPPLGVPIEDHRPHQSTVHRVPTPPHGYRPPGRPPTRGDE